MSAIPLIIEHVATGQIINFCRIKLSSFSDKLDTTYGSEEAFGRMDPITTYQGTKRSISMSFDIGSHTVEDMIIEMGKVAKLMEFQYPVYEDVDSATTLRSPPLLRVKFANYIQKEDGEGLLCAMKGMSYNPADGQAIDKSPRIYLGNIIPIRISVSLELTVLHEKAPGWFNSSFSGPLFISTTTTEAQLNQEISFGSSVNQMTAEPVTVGEQTTGDSSNKTDFEEALASATTLLRYDAMFNKYSK